MKHDWTILDEIECTLEDYLSRFADWIEEHPYKSMFFVTIPLCIITSVLTTVLLT